MASRLNRVDFEGRYPVLGSALSSPLAMTLYHEIDHEWLSENIRGALSALGLPNVYSKNPDDEDAQTSAQIARGLKVISMSICDAIADCIENSEAVKNALSGFLEDAGIGVAPNGAGTFVDRSNLKYSEINLLTSCADNDIMGQCIAIVEFLNIVAQDWVENLAALSFLAEKIGYVAQTNPLIAQIGTDFGDIIDWISDEVVTQYVGAYDLALRNDVACQLYSICCANCELTLDDLMDVFASNTSINLDVGKAFAVLLADLITLSLADQIVYGVWFLICATWKVGSSFNFISGIQALATATSNYTPADPLIIGCAPCTLDCDNATYTNTLFDATPSGIALGGVATDDNINAFYVDAPYTVALGASVCLDNIAFRVYKGVSQPQYRIRVTVGGVDYLSDIVPVGVGVGGFYTLNCIIPKIQSSNFEIVGVRASDGVPISGLLICYLYANIGT